jgi:hypothetical protein
MNLLPLNSTVKLQYVSAKRPHRFLIQMTAMETVYHTKETSRQEPQDV